jgi:hypothetical protein
VNQIRKEPPFYHSCSSTSPPRVSCRASLGGGAATGELAATEGGGSEGATEDTWADAGGDGDSGDSEGASNREAAKRAARPALPLVVGRRGREASLDILCVADTEAEAEAETGTGGVESVLRLAPYPTPLGRNRRP